MIIGGVITIIIITTHNGHSVKVRSHPLLDEVPVRSAQRQNGPRQKTVSLSALKLPHPRFQQLRGTEDRTTAPAEGVTLRSTTHCPSSDRGLSGAWVPGGGESGPGLGTRSCSDRLFPKPGQESTHSTANRRGGKVSGPTLPSTEKLETFIMIRKPSGPIGHTCSLKDPTSLPARQGLHWELGTFSHPIPNKCGCHVVGPALSTAGLCQQHKPGSDLDGILLTKLLVTFKVQKCPIEGGCYYLLLSLIIIINYYDD